MPREPLEKLADYAELSELTGLPVRTLRTLASRRMIPAVRLGHRTVKFSPTRVMRALERYEHHEINRRG